MDLTNIEIILMNVLLSYISQKTHILKLEVQYTNLKICT